MINSRTKGSAFERKLCKLLGDWWDCKFRRVPMSGGWAKDVLTGDITQVSDSPHGLFPFSVEAKHQKDWSIEGVIRNGQQSPVAKFLAQAISDVAQKPGEAVPLVIAKHNAETEIAFIPFALFSAMNCATSGIDFGQLRYWHGDVLIDYSFLKLADLCACSQKRIVNGIRLLSANERLFGCEQ